MPADSSYMLVIVTEGPDDVKILGALLERMGWQRQEEEWVRGQSRVRIFPSGDDRGGKDNIPTLISKYWWFADRFLVVFDPDDQNPDLEIERLCEQLERRLQESLYVRIWSREPDLRDRRIWIIREVGGREVLLSFWPAMVVEDQLSELIRASQPAHSIEDYVLQIGMQEAIVRRLLESRNFHRVRQPERIPPEKFIPKLMEILDLLRKQKIEVCSAKRVMDFYVALLGFRGGFGRLGAETIRSLDPQEIEGAFGGLPLLLRSLLDEQQTA